MVNIFSHRLNMLLYFGTQYAINYSLLLTMKSNIFKLKITLIYKEQIPHAIIKIKNNSAQVLEIVNAEIYI